MIIDLATIVCAGWGFFTGYRKGLLHSAFFLIGLVGGAVAALHFSAEVSEWMSNNVDIPQKYLPLLSFALIFAVVTGGVIMVANGIESLLKVLSLNIFNKIAGAAIWTCIALFLLSTVLWFLVQYELIGAAQLEASVTYPMLSTVSPIVVSTFGYITPFFQEVLEKLETLIDERQWIN